MLKGKSAYYRRVLLKLSGEALMGDKLFGIDPKVLNRIALEIGQLHSIGVEIGMVIGGGNIFRGQALSQTGIGHVTGDHIGMLATVMNSLAMQDVLEKENICTRIMSAITMVGLVETYDRHRAVRLLREGNVMIFSAGTGNPLFTTDSAACLRAIEVNADIVLKATKVDGVYSSDPMKEPKATKYDTLRYDEILDKQLGVMDLTAICLTRDHSMPVRVFNMNKPGALINIMVGANEGTLIK